MNGLDPVALTAALVQCRSVTPMEAGALSLLVGLLATAGFKVDQPVFSEAGTPDITNLFAVIGTGRPCLVFAGHTDVVPPGDETAWSAPAFSGAIRDGKLFGRGTADMKGGVAASVSAVLRHLQQHGVPKNGSIALLITGDEEGPAINGTVKLLAWAKERGHQLDHCILGEPTNPDHLGDMIKIGRRGSLTGHITVHGKQGHAAYPHLAQNPIPIMARLITALKAEPLDGGIEHFDPSNLEVTSVDTGNLASNVIPAEVRATFNIRFNALWAPQSLAAEIESRVTKAAQDTKVSLRFEPTNAVAFLTKPGPFIEDVSLAVEAETGKRPKFSTTGGTSDARFIKDYCEVVEFGLVGKTMHQIDEHVETADIETLTRIYQRVIARYFKTT
jgi:succinyl-diaminopimelate desuccinylase